jgi:hypothetical protein
MYPKKRKEGRLQERKENWPNKKAKKGEDEECIC